MQFGAHIRDIDLFDASAFGLSATEATAIDPQARLLMQLCGELLTEGAPQISSSMDSTGVFFGMTWTDYVQLSAAAGAAVSVYTAQGAVLGVTPGRISYHFGLKGPSIAMETACSSSLVAANAAREAIWTLGASALAGGINILINHATTYNTVRAGMLTQDGRCKALDANADGYVRSEGCAVMLLASEVVEEGCFVLLAATAVNQDGRSSALTAPNGPAQQNVLRTALALGGLHPDGMAGLSMHGTGTSLGDPIEIGAASSVLLKGRGGHAAAHPLALQASKSCMGHAEPASGIMSLLYLHTVSYNEFQI